MIHDQYFNYRSGVHIIKDKSTKCISSLGRDLRIQSLFHTIDCTKLQNLRIIAKFNMKVPIKLNHGKPLLHIAHGIKDSFESPVYPK